MPIKHIPGPEGVRGRNSNNDLIKEKLGYAPSVPLAEGLKVTFEWINEKIEEEVKGGANAEEAFSKSTICGTMAPTELGALRAADGQEGLKAKLVIRRRVAGRRSSLVAHARCPTCPIHLFFARRRRRVRTRSPCTYARRPRDRSIERAAVRSEIRFAN